MRLNPKYVLRRVAGEAILVSLEDVSAPKRLLCLNPLGCEIFTHLREGMEPEAIFSTLLEEYAVEAPVLRKDLDDFFALLIQYGVLLPEEGISP